MVPARLEEIGAYAFFQSERLARVVSSAGSGDSRNSERQDGRAAVVMPACLREVGPAAFVGTRLWTVEMVFPPGARVSETALERWYK